MSIFSISQYQKEVENIIHYGGTKKETAIRNAFYNLLNEYAKAKGLMLVTEVDIKASNSNKKVRPDGTLKDVLRQDWGYWESKDESDKIDDEIKKKFDKGYPKENILFEDSQTAVLFQNGIETKRVSMKDAEALHQLITNFINYERPEVRHFRQAIELFKQDIPKVTKVLREIINDAEKKNKDYKKLSKKFLKLCHDSINPNVTEDDIREMIIQHILTEDVFNTIFDENQFHRENNIASELEKVIHTFFIGSIRKTALSGIQHYYQAINAAAAGIADHHEKQKFLKVIYENFYKSYNPKAADRLGVVYTPNEIVHFMIKSTDFLLHRHFNRFLEDKGVEILDPATGTGTFITDIIDYISKDKLEFKYNNEIHANEIAILPYYISNLNIEFTYTQKMGKYNEYKNLCFVDTLDNVGFKNTGKQIDMFSPFTEENSVRIRKQNSRKIAVIIGNPPYYANQSNENDNNKNREYPEIDKRIKDTFVKFSAAQKTKVYDMYSRFFRWSMDRIQNNGIISFVTNNSFIRADGFDGFRKTIANEFTHCYLVDLGGDYRTDKEENVFGIKVGVSICFLIKDEGSKAPCQIKYYKSASFKSSEKLALLSNSLIKDLNFENVYPNKKNQWLELTDNDYHTLLPLVVKGGKGKALIQNYSNGLSTNRDEWVFDLDLKQLKSKINYFIEEYNHEVVRWQGYKISKNYTDIKHESNPVLDKFLSDRNLIKWSKMIKRDKLRKHKLASFSNNDFRRALYRPFVKKNLYFGEIGIDMKGAFPKFYPNAQSENITISVSNSERIPMCTLASNTIIDLNMFMPAPAFVFSLYHFDKDGNGVFNITDWGLNQFVKHYKTKKIKKNDIFNYIYAVLHNPLYKSKYELNLKRDFPRIPLYEDFNKWAAWGETLFDLHIGYENIEPFNLIEVTLERSVAPKAKLKAIKDLGTIIIDENTLLNGVPNDAWIYKFGNRSALEWVLDQYKDSKPKDATILEKFNTYKFSDYKNPRNTVTKTGLYCEYRNGEKLLGK